MAIADGSVETSPALQELFYKYSHLFVGGKEIACPYWVNSLKFGIFGPHGGKGTPEEIIETTLLEAKNHKKNLEEMSEEEIISFMKARKIGVDCSGFAFWMLDALDKEKGGNGIADDIPGSQGRYLKARANASMLTSDEVSIPVELRNIRVGDTIRIHGGRHIVVIISVIRQENVMKKIEYVHSSSKTEEYGVHKAEIVIVDGDKDLEFQDWLEKTKEGESYKDIYFDPKNGDGIKRLKIWQ